MKRFGSLIILIVLIVLVVVGKASMYVVREGEQVVVTEFGRPVGVRTEAGLNFKTPFIQEVHRLDKRLLPWDGDPENMQTGDKKRIFIDVWARWRIVDPEAFFKAVRDERRGYKILDDIVDSVVRDVVAKYKLIEVVRSSNRKLLFESEELAQEAAAQHEEISLGRAGMEQEIHRRATADLKDRYGMELVDVRMKRINYIESVRQTVYERMISERQRIAKLFESEAIEEKNRILGRTQKELDRIQGEQRRRSTEIRGNADAEVIALAAKAYSQAPSLYDFLRRLEAYKKTLGAGTRLILSTDNDFLETLRNPEATTKK